MKQKWMLLLLIVTIVSLADASQRVRLRDITSITLHRGQKTTGRRSSPMPQLRCVGGTAKGKFSPTSVQCYNRGFDGNDVQWECSSQMPKEFQFGKISVSCEGYDYPDDPYVLAGSCALEYELDYSKEGANRYYSDKEGISWFDIVVVGIVILVIVVVVYSWYDDRGTPGYGGRSGYSGDYPGGGGGGGPYPPGWRPPPSAPPSYDEATKTNTAPRGSNTNSGPGFWTGLGLGGLGGYFAARNSGNTFTRRRPHYQSGYDNDYYDDGYGGSTSYSSTSRSSSFSGTHTSSGFGGTTRR